MTTDTNHAEGTERTRRWRLLLGAASEQELGAAGPGGDDAAIDGALAAVYDADSGDGRLGEGSRPVAAPPGTAYRHRTSPGGSATSGPTSPPRSCR